MTEPKPPRSVGPPALAYVIALVVYIVLGVFAKSVVLNWIIGPLFPLLVLYLIPRAARAAGRRLARRDEAPAA